jgi:hypothetical protein
MIPVGDLQVGKPDAGGTSAIVDRFCRLTEQVRQRILATPTGRVQALILLWLGVCAAVLASAVINIAFNGPPPRNGMAIPLPRRNRKILRFP